MTAPHDEHDDDYEDRGNGAEHKEERNDRDHHPSPSHRAGEQEPVPRDERGGKRTSDVEQQEQDRLQPDEDRNQPRDDRDREAERSSAPNSSRHGDHLTEYHRRDAPRDRAADGQKISDRTGSERDPGDSARNDQASGEPINLFVRNVAKHVMEEQLLKLFSKYGKVDSAVVVRDPHSRECRGFGFVKMCTEDGVAQAIEELRDFEFEGRRIAVERAKRKAPHSRTPGTYMGVDRRVRDRYAGMKRPRDHDQGYGYGDSYGMASRGGYGGRYDDGGRGQYGGRDQYGDRGWGQRGNMAPSVRPSYDDRERTRRRYESEGPRYGRNFERDQPFGGREPPVPREPADDYI